MTTIATDGHTMAADGQVTSSRDYIVHTAETKIKRTSSGKIVGCSGGSGGDEPFINWLENGGDAPKLDESFCALVLSADGPPRVYWHDCTSNEIAVPYAIGSGAPFALAAMDLNKSPEEAVVYASTRDVYTGGVITAFQLEPQMRVAA